MSEQLSAAGGLAALLQQVRLQSPAVKSSADATQEQIDLLLARIALLTSALREATGEDTKTAARLLLADLAMVAAQFRGGVSATGSRLTAALEDMRAALESTAADEAGS